MSYILDALKKAERERDIQRVPTVMAEHEPVVKNRKSRWAVLGALVICVGAIIWFILFLQRTMNSPAPSPTAGVYSRGTGKLETQPGTSTSSAAPAAKSEASSEKTAGSRPIVPRAIVPAVPRDFPAPNTIDAARLRQMAEIMAAAAKRDDEDSEDNPPSEVMERPPARIPTPMRATKTEAPAAQGAKEKSGSLKEALNEMTLNILMYDENKADRMVFINGRKYVEGDYVEDIYLLESITLDGANLKYRGERALLKPKAK